jgi:Zn-dependent peptidase ImmA (M78 family)
MILGQPDKLHFEISLSSQSMHLGVGSLRAAVGKSPIWENEAGRGIEWTWIELLEQIARSWPFLKYEESAPPGAYDVTLSLLRTGHIATRDFDFEGAAATEVSENTYVFLRRHNLATGIEGLYLPSFSLLREGRKIWVASSNVAKLLDFAETIKTLTELGNVLSDSIASAASDDRAKLAVEAWRAREPSAAQAIEIRLGSSQLALVPPGQTVASYFEVTNDGEFESPLLLAARMSAAVPLENRRKILDLVRAVPSLGVSKDLEAISLEAQSALPTYAMRPHKQGEALAQWARKKFGLLPTAKADPEAILGTLGVQIRRHHFGVEMVDAIGCWSNAHGPAVLVNLDGVHAHAAPGARATLAHELAHVLLDRHGSLPAAEVLGDDAPLIPEQRASAFAAEFLLPKNVAAERIIHVLGVEHMIKKLQREFDVSRELAAWQVINGPAFHKLSSHEQQLLRRWTADSPYPRLF